MDTRTGEILTEEEANARMRMLRKELGCVEAKNPIKLLPPGFAPTRKQKRTNKIGRNDPCPCGSGRKFKKCCKRKFQ